MQDDRLTLSAAVVYAVMLDKAVDSIAHITATEIAEKAGTTQRTVRNAVRQLKECGYITDVKQGLGNDVHYTLKPVLPEKKRSKKQEQPAQEYKELEQPGQLSFETTEKGGTLEGDITPEQYRLLCELIASKLSGDVSSERCDKLLRGEYAKAKASAKTRIDSFYAYLRKMISNWETEQETFPEPEQKPVDMGGGLTLKDYERFINDFEVI